jgi:hypothetical protein
MVTAFVQGDGVADHGSMLFAPMLGSKALRGQVRSPHFHAFADPFVPSTSINGMVDSKAENATSLPESGLPSMLSLPAAGVANQRQGL